MVGFITVEHGFEAYGRGLDCLNWVSRSYVEYFIDVCVCTRV